MVQRAQSFETSMDETFVISVAESSRDLLSFRNLNQSAECGKPPKGDIMSSPWLHVYGLFSEFYVNSRRLDNVADSHKFEFCNPGLKAGRK